MSADCECSLCCHNNTDKLDIWHFNTHMFWIDWADFDFNVSVYLAKIKTKITRQITYTHHLHKQIWLYTVLSLCICQRRGIFPCQSLCSKNKGNILPSIGWKLKTYIYNCDIPCAFKQRGDRNIFKNYQKVCDSTYQNGEYARFEYCWIKMSSHKIDALAALEMRLRFCT